mgnify:CR=1 FL=1
MLPKVPNARDFSVLLASASPRRRQLLRAAGIHFEAVASNIPEMKEEGETPEEFAQRIAVQKAEQVRASRPAEQRPIVAADTVVVVDEQVLGKPASASEAAAMLRRLSGRSHRVITGLCVLDPLSGRRLVQAVVTVVRFAPLTEEEVREYVASGEPRDKAGAYAIQGLASRFVKSIEGCYFNVVGLPVPTLYGMLKQFRRGKRQPPQRCDESL